jgi:hypothetical protein
VLLDTPVIAEWSDGPRAEHVVEELSAVLHAAVPVGASFVLPFSLDERPRILPGMLYRSLQIILDTRWRNFWCIPTPAGAE